MFNRESTGALSHSQSCREGRGVERERVEVKTLEAVSHINETFKRHINKVDCLSGLGLPNIYISRCEQIAQPVSG